MRENTVLVTPTIDTRRLERYVFWGGFWLNVLLAACFFGLWLPFLIVWCLGVGQWYARAAAAGRRYYLTADKLIVEEGVFILRRKSIPLEKITDVSLSQGIIERSLDLWRLNVQTASSGAQVPEGSLLGVVDPQEFRRALFEARSRLAGDPLDAAPAAAEARLDRIEKLMEKIEANTRWRV